MPTLNIQEIEAILPQRYPFLLIDKVLDYKENDYLIAVKNITGNEWGMASGSAQIACWPEMLLVEAGAQAAIILYHVSKVKEKKHPQYFLGKIESDFLSPIDCGSQMMIKVQSGRMLASGGYSDIEIKENNSPVANLKIFYGIRPSND